MGHDLTCAVGWSMHGVDAPRALGGGRLRSAPRSKSTRHRRGRTVAVRSLGDKARTSDFSKKKMSERVSCWVGGEDAEAFADAYTSGLANLYDERTNASGAILLCRAENKLPSTKALSKRIEKANHSGFDSRLLGYQDYKGTEELRLAVAAYANRHIARKGTIIDPGDLMVSAGCGVVLENILFALCESGDKALVPAPFYGQFRRDLGMRAGVGVVPVHGALSGGLRVEDLEAAWDERCKVLLLTNPHNPCGFVYGERELKQVLEWAARRDLHVISDEIYACSVYKDGHDVFVSLLDLVSGLPSEWAANKCHTVFGFSKDFGASGLRIGCVHSRNAALSSAWNALGYSCAVSSHTQHVFAQILRDEEFVDGFLASTKEDLRRTADLLTSELAGVGIRWAGDPTAGLFLFIDLSHLLAEPTFSAEKQVGLLPLPHSITHFIWSPLLGAVV